MGVGEEQGKGDNSMVFWMKDMFARGFCMAFTRIQDSSNFSSGLLTWRSSVHLFFFSSFFPLAHEQGKTPVYEKDTWI